MNPYHKGPDYSVWTYTIVVTDDTGPCAVRSAAAILMVMGDKQATHFQKYGFQSGISILEVMVKIDFR